MAVLHYATRDDLYTATQKALGYPVINVEVDPDQYEVICDACIDEFCLEGNGAGGSYEDYAFLHLTSGTSAYSTSSIGDMVAVKAFVTNSGFGQVNQLFTSQHNLLTDQTGKFRLFNNMAGGNSGLELASYQSAMQYLELVREMLSKEYIVSLREMEQMLIVTPTPKETTVGLLTFFRRESELSIINNILFRNLFKAAIKIRWGENLGKYTGFTMPGGGSPDAQRIITSGETDYKEALERIRTHAWPVEFSVY